MGVSEWVSSTCVCVCGWAHSSQPLCMCGSPNCRHFSWQPSCWFVGHAASVLSNHVVWWDCCSALQRRLKVFNLKWGKKRCETLNIRDSESSQSNIREWRELSASSWQSFFVCLWDFDVSVISQSVVASFKEPVCWSKRCPGQVRSRIIL